MNEIELSKIKSEALQDNIPIIMDDTLEVIKNVLKNKKVNKILEIGTAVRLFCNLLLRIIGGKRKNRYNRKR